MNLPTLPLTRLLYAFAIICFPFFLSAQDITVKGKISDASSGKPIPGANITLAGSGKGTVSNEEGEFSLSAASGEKITVSSIGYENLAVAVGSKFLILQLKADNKQLNEVVVTALGVKKDVKRLGYAVQEVKGSDLLKARESNPVNGLVGKVAGLNVGINQE